MNNDYWLKGIANRNMGPGPIFYGTIGAPGKEPWQSATKWPLKEARTANFYFAAGPYQTPILDPTAAITSYPNVEMHSYLTLTITGYTDNFSLCHNSAFSH